MKKHFKKLLAAAILLLWVAATSEYRIFVKQHEPPALSALPATLPITEEATTTPILFPRVARVIDGDTIDIAMNADMKPERVRLIGINTPETVDPRKPVECFGKEASLKMKELTEGKSVRIEGDSSQDAYDKYHRRLAYVFLLDGTFVNKEMIAEGYAYEYTYRVPYQYQEEFKAAEHSAREAGRGLWASGACGAKTLR